MEKLNYLFEKMTEFKKIYEFALYEDNKVANEIAKKLLKNFMMLCAFCIALDIILILLLIYNILLQPAHPFLELIAVSIILLSMCKNLIYMISMEFEECRKMYHDYTIKVELDKFFNVLEED